MRDIVVYSTDADVPANLRCIGFFKDSNGYLPVRFNGETEGALRATMAAWWAEEAERQSKLRGGSKKPPVKPAAPPVKTNFAVKPQNVDDAISEWDL